MRKGVIIARYLREDGCYIGFQRKIPVFEEETADTAEIDRREEITKVKIENTTTVSVLPRIRQDRTAPLKYVRDSFAISLGYLYFLNAILKQHRQFLLQKLVCNIVAEDENDALSIRVNFEDDLQRAACAK